MKPKKFAKNTQKHFNTTSRAASKLGGAIAAIATIESARRSVMLADTYNTLQQRLKTATKATGDFVRVSREIFAISNRNGTSLQTNVELFQSLSRVAPEIGATTSEILVLAETVGQLGVIGGSSAEQMNNGLLQFTQGLAAGVLRAEEMNSILENIPEVANRIAIGMDMTVGGLRKAVLDGKVLSEDVFRALVKQAPEISKEFKDIAPTVSRSLVVLQNGFMQFLGQLDESTGTTEAIAVNLQRAAEFFSGDFSGEIAAVQDVFLHIGDHISLWSHLFGRAGIDFEKIQNSAEDFGGTIQELLRFTAEAVLELPINLRSTYQIGKESVKQLLVVGESTIKTLGLRFELTWEQIKGAGESAAEFIELIWAQAADNIINFFAETIAEIGTMVEDLPLIGDKFAGVSGLAADLKAMANNESQVVKSIAKANEARAERIHLIESEIKATKAVRDGELAASSLRIFSAKNERNSFIATINEKQLARQRERAQNETDLKKQMVEIKKNQNAIENSTTETIDSNQSGEPDKKYKAQIQSRLSSITDALSTERELEERHYKDALDNLRVAEKMKIDAIIPYQKLRERLKQQHEQRMEDIVAKSSSERMKTEAIGAFFGVDLTKKAGDLTLKEQGQIFKQQIDQASQHSREFFEIKKAMAMATALIEAPKSILSSYSFGSQIGGPALGAVFAGVAAAATAVQIAAISSAQYNGSKAVGGNVFAGGMYRVNEQGPEMLSVGSEDFLMMGKQSGTITPNKNLKGKSGVIVNIHNYSESQPRVVERETNDGTQIDVFIDEIDDAISAGIAGGTSRLSQVIEQQYGLNRAV